MFSSIVQRKLEQSLSDFEDLVFGAFIGPAGKEKKKNRGHVKEDFP